MTKYIFNLGWLGAAALSVSGIQAITLDFVSIAGRNASNRGSIRFEGASDTFSFVNVTAPGPSQGFSFVISGSDGAGDSFGDFGKIDGVFQIGAITVAGTKQTAPVTLKSGPGTLTIKDAAGSLLKGQIDWVEIFTDGTAGGLNSGALINLTGITYNGLENDLLALGSKASASLQFGFNPAKSLTALTANTMVVGGKTVPNVQISTFTGDLTATPDAGATSVLLASAVLGLFAFRRTVI